MSEESIGEEEQLGEQTQRSVFGEERKEAYEQLPLTEVILEKHLTFEEASRCLNTLGKDETGMRYAYLMITATNRKLTQIHTIVNFKHVLFVDLSGNYLNLDALQVLAGLEFLVLIKAERNRIESAALTPLPYLQVLSLNRNHITETCGIEQVLLDTLELHYNQIYTAQFDAELLPELKQLELRGNFLMDLSGSFPPTVQSLYLAENKISKIVQSDLSKLVNLKLLHLRDNQIRKLDGFSEHLVNLRYLNIRKNKINKYRQFRKLQSLPNLETLIITQNPVMGETSGEKPGEGGDEEEQEDEEDGEEKIDPSRIPLLVLLPNLKRINKVPVTFEEREEAYETWNEKYEEIMEEDSSDDETEMPTTTDFTTDLTTDGEDGETEGDAVTDGEA